MIELHKRARILVTGGTGFIGSHLTEKLSSEGFIFDVVSKENRDIRDRELNLDDYDVVYHLAAVSSPKACEDDPWLAWDVNVNGTLNILQKLTKNQKLVFASSAHVYSSGRRLRREDDALSPKDFYGFTKKVCEDLIAYYSKKRKLRYTILRFFNVYGPGQSRGFLIPDVIEKYKSGREVVIYNPEAVRDFLHVKDAVRALVTAAGVEGTFNIAYGVGTRIGDIYRIIKEEMRVEQVKERIIDRDRDALIGDISKARSIMGWEPRISLEEGIKEVIEYYI